MHQTFRNRHFFFRPTERDGLLQCFQKSSKSRFLLHQVFILKRNSFTVTGNSIIIK